MKSKKFLSFLLSFAMIFGIVTVPTFAENEISAEVNITAQADGAFLCEPQIGVSVTSDTAESYGYTDSITDGVSALDALVALHEIVFGDGFTREKARDYLDLDEFGYISKLFDTETSANGFILNGGYPNDGTVSPYGGYNGTTVTTQELNDNDTVEFFIYQDTAYWSDELAWFNYKGEAVTELTFAPESKVTLTLKTSSYMMAYQYIDAAAIHAVGSAVTNAQLAWVDDETGATDDIDSAVTDANGNVRLTMPKNEGTYYLTAYMSGDGEPLIMSLTKIVIDSNVPKVDPLALSSLSVASFESFPNVLTLTPEFSKNVTEYRTPVVDFPSMDLDVFRSAYVKAALEDDESVIKAECNGVTADITSGSDTLTRLSGALLGGKNNRLKITVAQSSDENAEKRTYTVIVPMKPQVNTAPVPSKDSDTAQIALGDTFGLDLSTIFTDTDEIDTLTYTVSVNGGDTVETDARYIFKPTATGEYELVFIANDGTADSSAYTVTLSVTQPDTCIIVPNDAKLFVGTRPEIDRRVVHFVPFNEVEPASVEIVGSNTKYYFDLDNNSKYNYRVSGDNYVTYSGIFTKTADFSLNITEEQLSPEGKTKTTVDRDKSSNNGYNVADIWLNINPQGYLRLSKDDTYQIVNLRNWETIDTTTNNYFIEPDYHYEVIDENGNETDVVEIDENGLITAKKSGTAIVLVTYDAINVNGALGGPFFGAIWPENTGVFVVAVDSEDSGIITGMTINEDINRGLQGKNSANAIDSEHDVIYFIGDRGEYTFTPATDGVKVFVANPKVGEKMTFNGYTAIDANDDGSVSVPLKEGRNIVKLEKDGKAEYQIITAKSVSVVINNGEDVKPGDPISIKFDTIYHPINKLAGVYNYNASVVYAKADGYHDKLIGSSSSQYTFASSQSAQTVSNIVTVGRSPWGMPQLSKGATLTVPTDFKNDTLTLSGGAVWFGGYGDFAGNHRGITYETGRNPNLNAGSPSAYLGKLPDIEIPIVATTAELESITLNTENVKTTYYEDDKFDTTNLVVTANYEDGTTQTATNYTITPEVLTKNTEKVTVTYRGKTSDIPVTVNELKVISIEITKAPDKTAYYEGETLNPTGMVVTATYNSGATLPIKDYSYSPNRELATTDTEMVVTYNGESAGESVNSVSQAITVTEKPSSGNPGVSSNKISVYFTLLGDSKNGAPTDESDTHTKAANNLETWIPKTPISVEKGSYVIDVVEKALAINSMPFENVGNYISEIKGLAELDNGSCSGWMYMLNGTHSKLGVEQQTVKNGDRIIFHYTDDYRKEEGSEKWNTSSSGVSNVYTVKFETNGGNTIKSRTIDKNDVVTEPNAPTKDGYTFEGWYTDSNLTKKYDFTQKVTANITLYAKWSENNEKEPTTDTDDNSDNKTQTTFKDVEVGSWYENAVEYAVKNNLFNGISETEFAPNDYMTRAMLVTVLYRLENPEMSETKHNFSDVAVDEWYSDAVLWAAENEVVSGISETEFAPNDNITREQMATIIYRYAKMKGYDTESIAELSEFTDVNEISDWAFDAVKWANSADIINGVTDTSLSPKSTATRAQVATILMRFCEMTAK